MRPKEIKIADVEYIAFRLAQKLFNKSEPIPDFESRFPGKLESCLSTPFQKFNKKYLYGGLISKAAVLFYLLNKNHPFQNGNKRIAMTTLLHFLYNNGYWLEVGVDEFYNFAKDVAGSKSEDKDKIYNEIKNFISKNLTKYNKNL